MSDTKCELCKGVGLLEIEGHPADCPRCKYKVGDKVVFLDGDDEQFTIEKDYGGGLYFIGNSDSFADLILGEELTYDN